jgi:hypothetical protein
MSIAEASIDLKMDNGSLIVLMIVVWKEAKQGKCECSKMKCEVWIRAQLEQR